MTGGFRGTDGGNSARRGPEFPKGGGDEFVSPRVREARSE